MERNYTTEVIPYIPVTAWKYEEESYLSGHIYRGSAYECADDCGTCDGACCDYCSRVTNRKIECTLSGDAFRQILSIAFPNEQIWEHYTLPALPTIHAVHKYFPELYTAIIAYLKCPDIFPENIGKKYAQPIPDTPSQDVCDCKITFVHSYVIKGVKGSLIKGSTQRALIKYVKDEKILSLSSSNLDDLRHVIPSSLLKCLDENMSSKFSYHDGVFKYIIPIAWLEDAQIGYVYI